MNMLMIKRKGGESVLDEYFDIVIQYPEELDEQVNEIIFRNNAIGTEVLDTKTLSQYEESAPEWELSIHDELVENQTKAVEYELSDGSIIQTVYFMNDNDGRMHADRMERQFYEQFGGQIEILEEKVIKNDNWDSEWKKYYNPIEIGNKILIVPAWLEAEKTERTVIKIDPGMAFGTGDHATTALCLEALEEMEFKNKTLLDIGSGSGILGIYAKRNGAREIDAVDIDENALKICKENFLLNDVEASIYESDLFSKVSGKFDIICANLLADIVVRMLDSVDEYLEKDGVIILSGILIEKADIVKRALTKISYEILEKKIEDEWIMIKAARKENL